MIEAGEEVECSTLIEAEPARVYQFLTDPEKLALWLGREISADPRPGGELRAWGESEHVLACEYLELVPGERVLLAWGWERGGVAGVPPGSTKVEITLHPAGAATRVQVRHYELPAEAAKDHEKGWLPALENLQAAAAGRPAPNRIIGDPAHCD